MSYNFEQLFLIFFLHARAIILKERSCNLHKRIIEQDMSAIIDTGPSTPCPQPFNLTAHVLGRADDLHDKVALSILSRKVLTIGLSCSEVCCFGDSDRSSGGRVGTRTKDHATPWKYSWISPSFIWLQLLSDSIQFRFRRNLRLRNWKNSVLW